MNRVVFYPRMTAAFPFQNDFLRAYEGAHWMAKQTRELTGRWPSAHGAGSRARGADWAQTRRLGERLMLFYTGVTRDAAVVLAEQRANIEDRRATLRLMADQARQGRRALAVGALGHESF